ncbi:hypothetical protein M011DRAFT_143011 [Sporormia fimetaria CBS 119925]|uniref:Uncharacterized protein n=1 Tax=Sporormia fimetaria CBS 119925 TaxID=1340428 RepID=A0A6A6V408_9PLEO|nr:hypothetical protein M011DRAFT_143011 [Sporormia fimetaria CBS 119925]
MPHAPPTPGEDVELTSPAVDYSPATVPYNEAFENELMNAILHPSPDTRSRTPHSPPLINPTTLPIPLDSPLRVHPSPIPGVLLTHVNGYHTGGPGPAPTTVSQFAERFIEENGIQDAEQLERVVSEKVAGLLDTVKERMREREEAVRKNGEIRRQLEDLEVMRMTELRVQEKIKEGKRKG